MYHFCSTLPATLGETSSSAGRVKFKIFNLSASVTVSGVTLKSTGFARMPSFAISISIEAFGASFSRKSSSDSENSTPATIGYHHMGAGIKMIATASLYIATCDVEKL